MSIWPPVAYLSLLALARCLNAIEHGRPRQPYNFNAAIASACIVCGILYWGGFFDPIFGGSR